MFQVVQLIEMVLSSNKASSFQSSRSHHPNEIHLLMKWKDILHVWKMVLQKDIIEIYPR
jgi:hypothetical protein